MSVAHAAAFVTIAVLGSALGCGSDYGSENAPAGVVGGGGGGGVVLRGGRSVGPNGEASLRVPRPSGVAPGDLLWLTVIHPGQTQSDAPGWTSRMKLPHTCKTAGWTTEHAARVATSDEPAEYVINTVAGGAASVIAYGGLDAVSGEEASPSVVLPSGWAAFEAPEVTASAGGSQLVVIFTNQDGVGASWKAPPGMQVRTSTGTIAIFDEVLPAAGPSGTRTATSSRNPCGATAVTLLLRPR